ncbi:MAG: sugar transferase [Betaproteobacteria bacterium]|nr:sugar transferase [Betaproteobacteria bacterium]
MGRSQGRATYRRRLALKLCIWRCVTRGTLAFKRLLDVAGALLGMLLLAPVFIGTWLAIRLEDGGPVLFLQERVGLHGAAFPMYKFRSMVVNADQLKDQLLAQNESAAGVLFKMKRDPRITRVGRVIRKLSIDELPQLYNVLLGHMSLVGPRPALPREVALYRPEERVRLEVRPGITCLWQIGGRSEIDFKGQVRLDVQYIREQSVLLDLVILLKTIPVVLLGRGAY